MHRIDPFHRTAVFVGQSVFRQTSVKRNVDAVRWRTRKYEQRLRAEAAEETRRRILDAVYERLREAPSQPVSVDQVARMAGVARSTVYLVFGSRAGLFDALAEDLMERGGYAAPDRGGRPPGRARAPARRHPRRRARCSRPTATSLRALHSMARARPGGRRRRGAAHRGASGPAEWRTLARRLAEQGLLRPDVTVGEAADILWVITSFDAFDLLYTGRDLPVQRDRPAAGRDSRHPPSAADQPARPVAWRKRHLRRPGELVLHGGEGGRPEARGRHRAAMVSHFAAALGVARSTPRAGRPPGPSGGCGPGCPRCPARPAPRAGGGWRTRARCAEPRLLRRCSPSVAIFVQTRPRVHANFGARRGSARGRGLRSARAPSGGGGLQSAKAPAEFEVQPVRAEPGLARARRVPVGHGEALPARRPAWRMRALMAV